MNKKLLIYNQSMIKKLFPEFFAISWSNAPRLAACCQMPHPYSGLKGQIPHPRDRKRCQMPGVCPGGDVNGIN